MKKVTLEFELPEDQDSLDMALDAEIMYAFIFDFSNWLVRKYKHTVPKSKAALEEYESIREEYFRMKDEADLKHL